MEENNEYSRRGVAEMLKRLEGQDLFSKSKTQFQEDQREAEAAVKALQTLEEIAKTLQRAGGSGNLEGLGKITVADLALMAARNHIVIETFYSNPKEPPVAKFVADWPSAACACGEVSLETGTCGPTGCREGI